MSENKVDVTFKMAGPLVHWTFMCNMLHFIDYNLQEPSGQERKGASTWPQVSRFESWGFPVFTSVVEIYNICVCLFQVM